MTFLPGASHRLTLLPWGLHRLTPLPGASDVVDSDYTQEPGKPSTGVQYVSQSIDYFNSFLYNIILEIIL